MPYFFVDDGYPDASEYANNYVWYDDADPEPVRRPLPEVLVPRPVVREAGSNQHSLAGTRSGAH